ncbi:ABC transporter substrate-binding protein [Desertimonas flava]|uniref:ABC transporter substrate-binding protein n=1 Tax=Desertimonas flava TaxID=2064846 RepID=UPI001877D77A|nr:ABC transporter substrate-binding protein [Desertimonas flava]
MSVIPSRRWIAVPAAAAAVLSAASFASAGTTPDDTGSDAAGGVDLSGVCPETIVIQTDWNPEAEHGWVYQMVGDDYEIDAGAYAVRGSLVAPGEVDTGVDIEVRSGGPAIGYQTVTSQIYADDSILLGYVYTDEGIQNAGQFPTVAIYAGMEKNPQIIMWDPETYPDVETIADLKETGATVRYFTGAAYMEYFVQNDILSADQVLGGYDGTPAAFVADQGAAAQQGFGSAEPYVYQYEVEDWAKPIAYDYINDAGWENYGESIATKPENIETYRDCFALLVPIIQQSSIDYLTDPAPTNEVILEAVDAFDTGWVYSEGVADYAVQTMLADGLIGNGDNDTIGDFDLDRVNNLIEIARPVYASLGQEPPADLTAEDVVTNEFIDPSIGLPAAPAGSDAPAGSAAASTDVATETTAAG